MVGGASGACSGTMARHACTLQIMAPETMAQASIIIATRNRCLLLPRAIESARRAGTDVEIVVVDDASEDRTEEVCRAFEGIRYVRARRRLGPGGARNVGLISSTSPY